MPEKIRHFFVLMRLHKPIGILLLLWPTLWALWLAASGMPPLTMLLIFIAGVVVMRSAGCIINDVADRRVDPHVARTAQRPLATGALSLRAALSLFAVLMVCALLLVLQLNTYTIELAFIGAGLTVVYPFMKRVTHLPQLGLGLAFSWGVPMAFAAVTNAVPAAGWWLFFTAALWPVIYDTMYAMTDREDDLKIGVKSTAILFARHDRLILGVLQIVWLLALALVGVAFHLNPYYGLSLLVVAGFLVYQQWLMRDRNPAQCFQAFLNNHWVGLVIFIGIVMGLRA
jgi:4-hydroxybenzoate polyprenyltransferase